MRGMQRGSEPLEAHRHEVGRQQEYFSKLLSAFSTHKLPVVSSSLVDMLISESHQDVPTTADGSGSMRKAILSFKFLVLI